jgi:hypothetical protein
MWRLAIVLLLGANLVGAFAFEEAGAVRLADRIVTSVLGEHAQDCCCGTDCACDHTDSNPTEEGCPSDCGNQGASPAPASTIASLDFQLPSAVIPSEPQALDRPRSLSDFVPAPPTHVPIRT